MTVAAEAEESLRKRFEYRDDMLKQYFENNMRQLVSENGTDLGIEFSVGEDKGQEQNSFTQSFQRLSQNVCALKLVESELCERLESERKDKRILQQVLENVKRALLVEKERNAAKVAAAKANPKVDAGNAATPDKSTAQETLAAFEERQKFVVLILRPPPRHNGPAGLNLFVWD